MKDKNVKSNKQKKEILRKKAEGKALREAEERLAAAKAARKEFVWPKKEKKVTKEKIEAAFKDRGDGAFYDVGGIKPEYQPWLKNVLFHLYDVGFEFNKDNVYVLKRMASWYKDAIRPIETWEIKSYNNGRQLSSLMRHFFAKYEVPHFMDKAWLGDQNWFEAHQRWFIHVGQGHNIRKAVGLPIPLTKKEAHYFLKAPKDFEIVGAIRYGQVLNLGGDEHFVRQLLRTRVGQDFANNDFWVSVFRWLLANPMLDRHLYAPLVDYIYNQKFTRNVVNEKGELVAAQPNFSMKDRDPDALVRAVEAWHVRIGREKNNGGPNKWNPTGFAQLYYETGKDENKRVYQTRELVTRNELLQEGRTMGHCVGSYAHSCISGQSSIWTLEETSREGTRKLLTMDVNPKTRTIGQSRGKRNSMPTAQDKNLMRIWCQQAGLSISRWMI